MMELDWGNRDPRWAGISSDTLTIGDAQAHVLRADPASVGSDAADATADPILLVHGLGGAATNWLEVIAGLARRTPVVAVDLAGFGHTRPPMAHAARIEPQVAFLVQVLDTLGWQRAEVHGNSMGGLLSILLAARHPRRVAGLVLVSPAFPADDVPASLLRMDRRALQTFAVSKVSRRLGVAALRASYRRATPEDVADRVYSLVLAPETELRPALRQVTVAQATDGMSLPWRSESVVMASSDLVTWLTEHRHQVMDAARSITTDILLIWGDGDRLVSQPAMDTLTTLRGDIARHDLAGIGHVAMLEVPDRYLDLVETWREALSTPVPAASAKDAAAASARVGDAGDPRAADDSHAAAG